LGTKESLGKWGAVLLLVLLAGSSAVLWQAIGSQLGNSATRVERETQTIEISLPLEINDSESVTLTSLQAMGVLLGVVAAAVVGAGVVLAFAYVSLSKQVTSLARSKKYKTHLTALDEREKEQIKRISADRSVASVPEHKMPRWSVVSTSLIILLFVTLFGMLVNGTFIPEGEYEINDQLVNSALPVVGGFVVVVLLLLIWRMRPKSLDSLEATDNESIPWDFIWVLLTGLLVVGLGIGAVVYLNVPA
jgi:hypothetical protein